MYFWEIMAFCISLSRFVSRLATFRIQKSFISSYSTKMTEPLHGNVKEDPAAPKLVLYGDEASPPVRFVMMTAAFVGVQYQFHEIDLFKGENKSEMFTKINPLQKVPALLVEENRVIAESVDIAKYFCTLVKSSSRNSLMPEENAAERAKINDMVVLNSKTLFPIDSAIFSGYFAGKWPADQKLVEQWNSSLDFLDRVLGEHSWLTGDQLRICDLCCVTTISSLRLLLPELDRHSNVKRWLDSFRKMEISEINERGLRRLNRYIVRMKPY